MNDIATKYIIPVSVIVGVLLAIITICCVCYRRWRFVIRSRQKNVILNQTGEGLSDAVLPNRNNSIKLPVSRMNGSRSKVADLDDDGVKLESFCTEEALMTARQQQNTEVASPKVALHKKGKAPKQSESLKSKQLAESGRLAS